MATAVWTSWTTEQNPSTINKKKAPKTKELPNAKTRDEGEGHPGFLVFNLSPWEAYPAPAVS